MKSLVLILVGLAFSGLAHAVDYEKDIMPIFVEKCADCHSKDSEKVKGGLRLDDPAAMQRRFGKNSLVIPGDWDASYLFITVFRPEDDEDAMPPKGKGDRLTVDEVKLVMDWITEGAPINGERGDRGEEIELDEAMFAHLPKGKSNAPDKPATAPQVERDWTNRKGQSIRATLVRVEGEVALLRIANGTVHRYPIEQLSDESRKQLEPTPKP
ncbi:MAG: cytochrome c5 [Verrucomicrobiales bacterium]|jgi:cytochrome c5